MELRRANNRQVFSKDVNNARVAAQLHVERTRRCNVKAIELKVLQEMFEDLQWQRYGPCTRRCHPPQRACCSVMRCVTSDSFA